MIGSGVIAVIFVAPVNADDKVASGGLGLEQVVNATLAASPELKLAATQVQIAAGALEGSRAPFDLTLSSSAIASRTNRIDSTGATAVQKDLTLVAGARRLMRNGILATS